MNCAHCGQSLPDHARFCIACGIAVEPASTGPTQRLNEPTTPALPQCPHCRTALVEGYIPGSTSGTPQLVWTGGTPPGKSQSHYLDPYNTYFLRAWRCPTCGYIELNARERRTL